MFILHIWKILIVVRNVIEDILPVFRCSYRLTLVCILSNTRSWNRHVFG